MAKGMKNIFLSKGQEKSDKPYPCKIPPLSKNEEKLSRFYSQMSDASAV